MNNVHCICARCSSWCSTFNNERIVGHVVSSNTFKKHNNSDLVIRNLHIAKNEKYKYHTYNPDLNSIRKKIQEKIHIPLYIFNPQIYSPLAHSPLQHSPQPVHTIPQPSTSQTSTSFAEFLTQVGPSIIKAEEQELNKKCQLINNKGKNIQSDDESIIESLLIQVSILSEENKSLRDRITIIEQRLLDFNKILIKNNIVEVLNLE
ncbi:uncharacterized protein OCT59_019507 [Rhizophagus irregularis]|uniref:Uncharacterized protein n=1 Tax=Rhizophagus irregularis (strain DAOM 197198w) TaxID=1432141 RepID=A0A015J7K9_RHIIW|nr:hypothetical protein RirG_132250 [Rhizophagus irregularis DAOM 197198w]UZO27306.1 hypothetical protein OCT59_019507 [Rhizophagus irregularis]GBC51507.1 hypothetical protein GLOIN_2v1475179 [Rhizophagus irregularis DAOM 181602=DAOM 197198]